MLVAVIAAVDFQIIQRLVRQQLPKATGPSLGRQALPL